MEFCLNCRQKTNYIEEKEFKECKCGRYGQHPSEVAGEIFCHDNITDQLWAIARVLTEQKKHINLLERPGGQFG